MAAKLLADFNAAVAEDLPRHRVSEIHSYMACRVDDAVSESPQRDVSYVASRAKCSKIPWWSASVRLRQNLAMVEEPGGRGAIEALWPTW